MFPHSCTEYCSAGLTWIHRMGRSGRWDRCTCWVWSRNHLHMNSGRSEQCTGFLQSESSSLGSSRRCSLSHTHLVLSGRPTLPSSWPCWLLSRSACSSARCPRCPPPLQRLQARRRATARPTAQRPTAAAVLYTYCRAYPLSSVYNSSAWRN